MNERTLFKVQMMLVCLGIICLELGLIMMWNYSLIVIFLLMGLNLFMMSIFIELFNENR